LQDSWYAALFRLLLFCCANVRLEADLIYTLQVTWDAATPPTKASVVRQQSLLTWQASCWPGMPRDWGGQGNVREFHWWSGKI